MAAHKLIPEHGHLPAGARFLWKGAREGGQFSQHTKKAGRHWAGPSILIHLWRG